MAKKGNVTAIIDADASGLKKEMEKMRGQMARFTRDTNKNMSKFNKSMTFGKATAGLASMAAGFVSVSVAMNVVKGAISTIANFEQGMSKVKAVSGATESQMAEMSAKFQELGRTTKYTATQAAELGFELSKLGFTSDEIIKSSDAVLALAAATGTELSRAAEVAGITLRQYNLDASEAQHLTSVMALSFSKSALDIEKFAEAMKYAGPSANAAGVSMEFTTAMLAKLADVGISGSMAGTALNRILIEMAKTGKPAAEAFEEIAAKGITLSGSEDQVGKFAMKALLALSKMTGQVSTMEGIFKGATDEVNTMATVMEDNLLGDVTRLSSAYDGWILKGEGVIKMLRGIVQATTEAFKSNEERAREQAKSMSFSQVVNELELTEKKLNKLGAKSPLAIGTLREDLAARIAMLKEEIEIKKKDGNISKQALTTWGQTNQVIEEQNALLDEMRKKTNAVETERAKHKAQEKADYNEEAIKKAAEYQKEFVELSKEMKALGFDLYLEGLQEAWDGIGTSLKGVVPELQSIEDALEDIEGIDISIDSEKIISPFTEAEEAAIRSRIKVQEELQGMRDNILATWADIKAHGGEFGANIGSSIASAYQVEAEANKNAAKEAEESGRTIQEVQAENAKARKNSIREQLRANASMILSELVLSAVSGIPFPANLIAAGVAVAAGNTLINSAIPALAEGGVVNKPTLSLIGEAGPEAVIPLSKMKDMGGGGLTINVTGFVGNEVELGQRIKEAIKEHDRRG